MMSHGNKKYYKVSFFNDLLTAGPLNKENHIENDLNDEVDGKFESQGEFT